MHTDTAEKQPPLHWTWFTENDWGGYCNSKVMQSPIEVNNLPDVNSTEHNYRLNYKFSSKVAFQVRVHGEEVVIDYLDPTQTGLLELDYGEYYFPKKIFFQPTGMYFRFRAEHPINSKRYDGEFVFTFEEKTKDNDKVYIENLSLRN